MRAGPHRPSLTTVTQLSPPAAPADTSRRAATGPGWLVALAVFVAALVAVPIASVATNIFHGGTGATWAHLASTVLPEYVAATLWLCAGVGLLVAAIGVGAAWLVTHYDFALRRSFEWMLVLPLAMPAYVMAYCYTDLLQFAGPVQGWLRDTFGWTRADYWFPDVRSLGGAVWMFAGVLYPYVYMLARTAFLERGGAVFEAGRSLGLSPWQSFLRVSLPMARPAIAAGTALALMETLADYGTVSYFAVNTFTTGIYRAWFSLGDRTAAAQLAMSLLGFVVLVLALERLSRGRARFHGTGLRLPAPPVRLRGVRALLAIAGCLLPVLGGFLLPAGVLLRMALVDGDAQFGPRFLQLAGNSFTLSAVTALLAVSLALMVAYARRLQPHPLTRLAHAATGMGYALPGSVIAVGVLIPVTRLDNVLADFFLNTFGWKSGLLFTGSIAALVYACLVRYLTAALQSVDAALHRVTSHMDDAARSLGLSPGAVLKRVHLPLLRRGLLTAGLLVFIDVMKELPATLVMRPFNFDTLATQVYTLASDERLTEASTAALAIVVVGLLPLVVLSRQIAQDRR
ncbi:MAG: iron ABC transporter permease [Rhizobacter sp.]